MTHPLLEHQSVDGEHPAVGVVHAAPLDAGQRVVQVTGQGAHLVVVDDIVLAVDAQLAHGGDDGSGAAAPDLVDLALLQELGTSLMSIFFSSTV